GKVGARNGRWPFCSSTGRDRCHGRADLSSSPSLDDDECIRAAHLGRVRMVCGPRDQSERAALLALVRYPHRARDGKQIHNGLSSPGSCCRLVPNTPTAFSLEQLDLDWSFLLVSALSSELDLADPLRLPVF